MIIELSDHAKNQISPRKIPVKIVIDGVMKHDEFIDSYKGRELRRIKHEEKLLEIVTVIEGSKIIVITAYYLDKEVQS